MPVDPVLTCLFLKLVFIPMMVVYMQYLEVREKQYDVKAYVDLFTVSLAHLSMVNVHNLAICLAL